MGGLEDLGFLFFNFWRAGLEVDMINQPMHAFSYFTIAFTLCPLVICILVFALWRLRCFCVARLSSSIG